MLSIRDGEKKVDQWPWVLSKYISPNWAKNGKKNLQTKTEDSI